MMHLISGSIILGFLRLCFILVVMYYLNRKFVNKSQSNSVLEFIAHHWFRYGSIIAIVLFLSVQLSIYNLFNCMIILMLIVMADVIGMKNIANFREYFKEKSQNGLYALLKNIELKRPKFDWLKLHRRRESQNRNLMIFIIISIIASITFGSRYYFTRYDMYSMSAVWLNDLEEVKDFDFQMWFLNESSGDFAFANLYSKVADVSPEIALQSMGLLQSTLISVLIFWMIRRCTPSKTIAPIAASMSFALAYVLMPVNVYFILQSKPIYMALTFGIPTMVFLLKPALLKFRKTNYFFSMLLAFIAIGLMDLFTLLILFPPFVVLAMIFTRSKSKKYFWPGALAYLTSLAVLLFVYVAICYFIQTDLETFVLKQLISISSYTYIPQLILPFDMLIEYSQIASLIAAGLCLAYVFLLKDKSWNAALAILLYFNAIVLIGRFSGSSWIDKDLVNEALAVFMHVVGGLSVAVVLRLFRPLLYKVDKLSPAMPFVMIALLFFAAVSWQKGEIEKLEAVDSTPKQVLDAYDKISTTFFPFSYAVVNDNSTQAISTNKHFFMNYTDFIFEYPKQDSIYFANIGDPEFLRKNPEYALPKSVLLFVFSKTEDGTYSPDGDISETLLDQLAELKQRGRQIGLFYRNKNVQVYEIINEEGESRVSDLIF